jgi:hypothetical protein
VEPEASRQGSRSRSELLGHCYRVWIASGADSDEAVSFGPHFMPPPGTVRQLQPSAEVGDASNQPAKQDPVQALPSCRQHAGVKLDRPPGRPKVCGQTRPTGSARDGRRSLSCRQVCSLTGQARRYADSDAGQGPEDSRSSHQTSGPGLGPDSGRAVHGQGGVLVQPFFAPISLGQARAGPCNPAFSLQQEIKDIF